MFYFWGAAFDLVKYFFPWQMWFFWRGCWSCLAFR